MYYYGAFYTQYMILKIKGNLWIPKESTKIRTCKSSFLSFTFIIYYQTISVHVHVHMYM